MPCQIVIQKGVVGKQDFFHRPIGANDVLKEVYRLVVKRRSQSLIKLGKLLAIDAAVTIELIKPKPLAKKLGGEAASLGIGEQPAGLLSQCPCITQFTGRSRPPQLIVRQRRPNEKTQSAGQFMVRKVRNSRRLTRSFGSIEKIRGDQNPRQQGANGLRMIQFFSGDLSP